MDDFIKWMQETQNYDGNSIEDIKIDYNEAEIEYLFNLYDNQKLNWPIDN